MPVSIHGKEYVTVAERITKAGKELIAVNTEVLYIDPVVIKATITTTKGTFTGISAANASKQIEKESPFEVAETSAVGRALAFAGYETTGGIASAEEIKKAMNLAVNNPTLQAKVIDDRMEWKDTKCPHCGGDIVIGQSGKPYCKNKCWLDENLHLRNEYAKRV